MTKRSGGDTVDRGPAPRPDREPAGESAGNVRAQGGDPSPGESERGEASDAGDCTAHDRAS